MAERVKRIDLSSVPGAGKNRVRSMISCGVRTRSEALTVAEAFIADLEKVTAKSRNHATTKPKS